MQNHDFILNMTIIIMSQIAAVWKNGTQHQMTLFCAVVVAGEQTQVLRLFVLPVKSIIVWIVWQHLIYAMDRSSKGQ
jgi:hypothetical protein